MQEIQKIIEVEGERDSGSPLVEIGRDDGRLLLRLPNEAITAEGIEAAARDLLKRHTRESIVVVADPIAEEGRRRRYRDVVDGLHMQPIPRWDLEEEIDSLDLSDDAVAAGATALLFSERLGITVGRVVSYSTDAGLASFQADLAEVLNSGLVAIVPNTEVLQKSGSIRPLEIFPIINGGDVFVAENVPNTAA